MRRARGWALAGVSLAVRWASPMTWASSNMARVMIAGRDGSGDQVHWSGGCGLGAAAGGLAAAAEHHVPGVFRVAQDRANRGLRPVQAIAGRVAVLVRVQPGGDRGHAQVLFYPPRVDHSDHRPTLRVKD